MLGTGDTTGKKPGKYTFPQGSYVLTRGDRQQDWETNHHLVKKKEVVMYTSKFISLIHKNPLKRNKQKTKKENGFTKKYKMANKYVKRCWWSFNH